MRDANLIRHILGAIEKIESYTQGMSENDFVNHFPVQDAVMRNPEIIDEASKKLSPALKANLPSIPWKQMDGMRDKLIHDRFWNRFECSMVRR